LGAASGVTAHAARSRASSEIEAMKIALDAYKIDNGAYPAASTLTGPGLTPAAYPLDPTTTDYQTASAALFLALAGTANYSVAPATGVKTYMNFKINQVGSPTVKPSYVKDPWNNAYGYSTGDVNYMTSTAQTLYPNNGKGSYDIWSTAGTKGVTTTNPNPTNAWICNWQ
jgi:hypothetical protein